jgi:NtrC-family two-component system response regulator AlgB
MNTPWYVLILDDDPGVRQSIRLCLEADGAQVLGVGTSAGALEALERRRFDVVFLDLWLKAESGLSVLPEMLRRQGAVPIIVITAYASYESAVEAMKLGAIDYLPKPFTPEQVRNAARRAVSETLLKRQLSELRERIDESEGELIFETRDPVYRGFLQTALRVADSESVVLLRGESGTGKNVLARWMRDRSRRAERPFVTVHCPMLSNELMSSTLFGHCRGAFTGAVADAVGKVEEAEGGTLFLDEVGELSADTQARLLRFLNDRSYERLGEAKERQADVRIIAATNRNLENEVKSGRFREDLFFRLNVITLSIPPLRDRPQDILPLAAHYLRFFQRRQGRREIAFSARSEAALVIYTWPGNYRELRNAVERATILAPTAVIEPEDLGLATLPANPSPRGAAVVLGGNVSLEELEREHIARVVSQSPSFEAAAKILGIDVTTLQRKRKRYGLA